MTRLYVIGAFGGQRIAVDATAVEAVVDIAMVVPVPHAPRHIIGIAAIRSQVLTVIDCACLVGGADVPPTGRALLVQVDGHRYALRLDRVDDVTLLAPAHITGGAVLQTGWNAIADGMVDVGDGLAIVIDPARIVGATPTAIAA